MYFNLPVCSVVFRLASSQSTAVILLFFGVQDTLGSVSSCSGGEENWGASILLLCAWNYLVSGRFCSRMLGTKYSDKRGDAQRGDDARPVNT